MPLRNTQNPDPHRRARATNCWACSSSATEPTADAGKCTRPFPTSTESSQGFLLGFQQCTHW